MVQVDLPAAFAIGQIYAALSKDFLRKEPHLFTNRLLGPFNIFMSCCYAPVGMFLLIGWPAWEVMYLTGWVENPFDRPWVAGFYVLFAIAMVVLGNVGFILAHHWFRKGLDRWVTFGTVAGLALTVLPFLLRWGVWWKVGTYREVAENGGGYSFWSPPFFWGWLSVMSCMVVSIAAVSVLFRPQGNRLEP